MRCNIVFQTETLEKMRSVKRITDFFNIKKAVNYFKRMDIPEITKAWLETSNLTRIKFLKGGKNGVQVYRNRKME